MATVTPKTIIRQKKSVTVESGFLCSACGFETVTYDGYAAAACLSCGTVNPKQVWQTKVLADVTTEVTQPMPIAPPKPKV